jgi:divalent metal cation (Fe/Co/Zn/Cd) transporter
LAIAAFLGIACFEILQGAIMRIIKGGKPVEIAGSELWLLIIVLGVNIFVTYNRPPAKIGTDYVK